MKLECDVLIAGAGPAGIAAACAASECGRSVTLLDDNPAPGGQIWRRETRGRWMDRLARCQAKSLFEARVITGGSRSLRIETPDQRIEASFTKLILATGARELFLPFPGWTLPNVMGAGGLQALAKCGLPVEGKRVIVAGSGPLLLAVADYLRRRGAVIPLIAEQAPMERLRRFVTTLLMHPGKIAQGTALRIGLRSVPYLTGCWVTSASGGERLERVRLHRDGRDWEEPCDYLAIGYGLVPNSELAALLGCRIENGAVQVDDRQQTSVPPIYAAGEVTGIGGVDLSLVEGEIAGSDTARPELLKQRAKWQRFATALNDGFALRDELKALPGDETLICRCEDVRLGQLKPFEDWRSAKLQTRCGMGPCQGRICGPAVAHILGWKPESVRPPVFPARIGSFL